MGFYYVVNCLLIDSIIYSNTVFYKIFDVIVIINALSVYLNEILANLNIWYSSDLYIFFS